MAIMKTAEAVYWRQIWVARFALLDGETWTRPRVSKAWVARAGLRRSSIRHWGCLGGVDGTGQEPITAAVFGVISSRETPSGLNVVIGIPAQAWVHVETATSQPSRGKWNRRLALLRGHGNLAEPHSKYHFKVIGRTRPPAIRKEIG